MGLEPVLEGLADHEAVEALRGFGHDVAGIRRWLAFYGYFGPRCGANGVTVGRVGLVLAGDRVVTVVMRGD